MTTKIERMVRHLLTFYNFTFSDGTTVTLTPNQVLEIAAFTENASEDIAADRDTDNRMMAEIEAIARKEASL